MEQQENLQLNVGKSRATFESTCLKKHCSWLPWNNGAPKRGILCGGKTPS